VGISPNLRFGQSILSLGCPALEVPFLQAYEVEQHERLVRKALATWTHVAIVERVGCSKRNMCSVGQEQKSPVSCPPASDSARPTDRQADMSDQDCARKDLSTRTDSILNTLEAAHFSLYFRRKDSNASEVYFTGLTRRYIGHIQS
jgi:hypothetical protein